MTKNKNTTESVKDVVDKSPTLKPSKLYMSDLKWKYLVRSALRGKNILVVGPTGQGKTFAVQCLVEALFETIEEEVTEERLNELKAMENITIIKTEELK
jgi:type IV secretory pathway ATPase VirB11/archaellum biosynthesis ATPase